MRMSSSRMVQDLLEEAWLPEYKKLNRYNVGV